jgi:hypothetical protein
MNGGTVKRVFFLDGRRYSRATHKEDKHNAYLPTLQTVQVYQNYLEEIPYNTYSIHISKTCPGISTCQPNLTVIPARHHSQTGFLLVVFPRVEAAEVAVETLPRLET